MKSLLILPLALILSMSASAASLDGKTKNQTYSGTLSEIKHIFKNNKSLLNNETPSKSGSAVVLIEIDSLGNAKVIESNASSDEMIQYVERKISSKDFRNVKNETIRLVIDFRK
ncbi:MAG: hypothetical protein WED33_03540 [Bacteroidia bacterium]